MQSPYANTGNDSFFDCLDHEFYRVSEISDFLGNYASDCWNFSFAANLQYKNTVGDIEKEEGYNFNGVYFGVFEYCGFSFVKTFGILELKYQKKRHVTPFRIRPLHDDNKQKCAVNFVECIKESFSDLYVEMLNAISRGNVLSRCQRISNKINILGVESGIWFDSITKFSNDQRGLTNHITLAFKDEVNANSNTDVKGKGGSFIPCYAFDGKNAVLLWQKYVQSVFDMSSNQTHNFRMTADVKSFQMPIEIDVQEIENEETLPGIFSNSYDAISFAFCVKTIFEDEFIIGLPTMTVTEENVEEIVSLLSSNFFRRTTRFSRIIYENAEIFTLFLKKGLRLLNKFKRNQFMPQIDIEMLPDSITEQPDESTISVFSMTGNEHISQTALSVMMSANERNVEKKETEYLKMIERIKQRDPEVAAAFISSKSALQRTRQEWNKYKLIRNRTIRDVIPKSKSDILWHHAFSNFSKDNPINRIFAIKKDNEHVFLINTETNEATVNGLNTYTRMMLETSKFIPENKKAFKKICRDLIRYDKTYEESISSLYNFKTCRSETDGSYQGIIERPVQMENLKMELLKIKNMKELLKGSDSMKECGFDMSLEGNAIVLKKRFNSFRFMNRFIVPITVDVKIIRNQKLSTIYMKGTAFERSSGNWHPHVNNGEFCMGNFKDIIIEAIDTNQPEYLMDAITAIMNCYNPSSPYHRIDDLNWQSVMDANTQEWISYMKMIDIYKKEIR